MASLPGRRRRHPQGHAGARQRAEEAPPPPPEEVALPGRAGRLSTRAYIGLGSNLDDPRAQLDRAVEALGRIRASRLAACSPYYATGPLGYAAQPEFVNAVAALDTSLGPLELLDALQEIERLQGRERPFPNAPRTLDLDLLLLGERVESGPRLTLPHPRMQERAFVLQPLLDLAPGLAISGLGPARDWLSRCAGQAIRRLP